MNRRGRGAVAAGGRSATGAAVDPAPLVARLAVLVGVVVISFSAIFVRLSGSSPTTAALFRAAYALPVLLLLWAWVRREDRRSWSERALAAVAGLLLGLDLALWHRAIELIGAGLSTVLGNTQVLFVGLAAWALYGERPSRLALAVTPVVLVGVVLTSGLGQVDSYGVHPGLGVLYGIGTGITYAIFLLLLRQAGRSGRGPKVGLLLDATVGVAVFSLAVGVVDPRFDPVPSWPAHGWLVALALASQVGGWLVLTWALPRLAALESSVLLLLQPPLTILWAGILFRENLGTAQGLGALLVLLGVGFLSAFGSVDRPLEATDEPTLETT